MRNFKWVAFVMLLVFISCKQEVKEEKIYTEDWESLYKANATPDWFLDAKFGIYAHWGPVSSAFEGAEEGHHYDGWHGMFMYGNKGRVSWSNGGVPANSNGIRDTTPTTNYLHHTKKYGDPAEFGYTHIVEQFDPSGFDAEEWADLFEISGAKFAGPVAMHHDNFAMWDSKTTRWNSMNYGGLDVAGELKTAIEARGMKYMGSFHHAFTWMYYAPAHEYGGVSPEDYDLYTDPHDISNTVPSDNFNELWWAKLKEFIDVYQPDMVWFDWWLENLPEEYRKKFLAYYYNKGLEWNKEVAICFKETTFPEETAIRDYERGRPNQPKKPAWLTDTSPGAWFYRPHTDFVEANDLIDILVDIVSKNGCMLLNVPPDPDGSIPQEMKDLLIDMGAWLKVNGEAIYGTRVWTVFGEGPTRLTAGGHKVEESGRIIYTNEDIRFTKKSDVEFFAIVLDKPMAELKIKTLGSMLGVLNGDIEKITLLGSDEEIKWKRVEDGLIISAPKEYPSDYAHAFKFTMAEYREADI